MNNGVGLSGWAPRYILSDPGRGPAPLGRRHNRTRLTPFVRGLPGRWLSWSRR